MEFGVLDGQAYAAAVKLSLLGIAGDHIAVPAGAFTGKDFFDVKIIDYAFRSEGPGSSISK